MKVYLVGGAVRDQLLNYPFAERDWVVVGAIAAQLLEQGYKQVGRDFPVFLHPETREEYALARTERKMSAGYYGFACDFNSCITLEQDLARRDLTINAMAIDEYGNLIDPYGGAADLSAKLLRHVSLAFVEDPVRVLRVARFAARYHHLGFRLADETRSLMYTMVSSDELNHLVAERIWQELERALCEKNPEQFIWVLRACGALKIIFPEIDELFGIPNKIDRHPEIDSGIHSMMVLTATAALSTDMRVRFAALVHDLGKASTPMQQWPSHPNHSEAGLMLIDNLCKRLRIPVNYRKLALIVAKFHIKIHNLDKLSAESILELLEQTHAFNDNNLFDDLLLVCRADAHTKTFYHQTSHWRDILFECKKINAGMLIAAGYSGSAIKQAMHELRLDGINLWKQHEA